MDKVSEYLRKNYKGIAESIAISARDNQVTLSQIDDYFVSAALWLWAHTDFDTEKCTEIINQIQSAKQNNIYDASKVADAINYVRANNVKAPFPKFLNSIIRRDAKYRTDYTKRALYQIGGLLTFFALSDGVVKEREGSIIAEYLQKLAEYCRKKDVSIAKEELFDPGKYVVKSVGPESLDKFLLMRKETAKNPYEGKTIHHLRDAGKLIKPTDSQKAVKNIGTQKGSAYEELDSLIGLENVKEEVKELTNFVRIQKVRQSQGLPAIPMSYHLVFTGNPGTGKTTVARILADIYKKLGIVSKGHLVEVDRSGLVAGYAGQTAIKTKKVIDSALGGVLFIDEAYSLISNDNSYGQEAIDTLLKAMEDHRDDLIVIVAGYEEPMKRFINSNPGLKSRFNRYIVFPDYNGDELTRIFDDLCAKNRYVLPVNVKEKVKKHFESLSRKKLDNFSNGREVRNYFEKTIAHQANRIAEDIDLTEDELLTIEMEDLPHEKETTESLNDVMREFNSLIGLSQAKQEITELISFAKTQSLRKKAGLPVADISMHLVFSGNPGTGKTTVARYIGRIYKCLGLLHSDTFVETDRAGLVAGYVGQTAAKTKDVINEAMGGVLFIDEAYTLVKGINDYGQEAIDTLLKEMEDHRDNLVVIVAGYDEQMNKFILSNPGLESRFNTYIHFDDYSPDELMSIFDLYCQKGEYSLSTDAENQLRTFFSAVKPGLFGNGRGVRNIFEKIIANQAYRLSRLDTTDTAMLSEFTKEDVTNAIREMRCNTYGDREY